MVLFNILVYAHLLLFKSKSKILLVISFICLLIICGYRSIEVGTDTVNYYLGFQYYSSGGEMMHEPLWYLLNKIVFYARGDFDSLKVLASALTLLPFYLGIHKVSKFPFFSIFVFLTFYYYFYSFNIVRQCLAMSWCFLGIVYFNEKKINRKSLIFLTIGVLFHYTAIMVPLLLMVYKAFHKLKFNFLFIQVVTIILGLILGGVFVSFARIYLDNYSDIAEKENSLLSSFINVLILNIAFVVFNSFSKNRDKWFYFFFFFIIITNLIIRVPVANRFIIYAGIALTVFFANVMEYVKLPKKISFFVYFILIIYSLFRFYRIMGSGEILPYDNMMFN